MIRPSRIGGHGTPAGLGGSPFTAAVAVNLSLETAADALAGLGVATRIDPAKAIEAGWLAARLAAEQEESTS